MLLEDDDDSYLQYAFKFAICFHVSVQHVHVFSTFSRDFVGEVPMGEFEIVKEQSQGWPQHPLLVLFL